MTYLKKSFTLIELLIVIAIIGILMSILLPSLAKARYQAKHAVCASRFAQLGRIMTLYAQKNDNKFPPHRDAHWIKRSSVDFRNTLEGYLKGDALNNIFNDPLGPLNYDYATANAQNIYYPTTIWGGSSDAQSPKTLLKPEWNGFDSDIIAGDYNQNFDRLGGHKSLRGSLVEKHLRYNSRYQGAVWKGPTSENDWGTSKVDHNYLYSDLSVRRIQNFGITHPDLIKLPSLNPSHKGHFIPKSR